MLKIVLIRHSKTAGNLLGRYIGRTDESLCDAGIRLLRESRYPDGIEKVYISPMKRCVETAEYIYPGISKEIVEDFREIDFGDFENKNYQELDGNPDYQAWIDSGGTMQIPNAEKREVFQKRCCDAFLEVLRRAEEEAYSKIAVVAHGGTLMSILDAFAEPHEDYYHWQVKNGRGFVTIQKENGKLEVLSKLPIF